MNRPQAPPQRAQPQASAPRAPAPVRAPAQGFRRHQKRNDIDLTLYIRAAKQLGYDSRKVKKGTKEYESIMSLKNKMKSQMGL